MYNLSKEEFLELAKTYNVIPLYVETLADIETPVAAFKKLAWAGYAYLLESAERGERFGRYSFIGVDPSAVAQCRGGEIEVFGTHIESRRLSSKETNPFDVVRDLVKGFKPFVPDDLPPFFGGVVGYMGYDIVRTIEDIPDTNPDDLDLPDMIMMLSDDVCIFDHLTHKMKIIANAHTNGDPAKAYESALKRIAKMRERLQGKVKPGKKGNAPGGDLKSTVDKDRFERDVQSARDYIMDGDILQVVLSQRFSRGTGADPFDIYRALRSINPAPYMYYLDFGPLKLIGSSPEPLVKVDGDDVLTCPIAGTRRRGASGAEDEALGAELLGDDKEKAEHIMLVDLARNDLGRVCVPGTIKVDDFMTIEKASHVMHIVSRVTGKLAAGMDAFDALKACFPAGTVSGAPKVRAMEIIDELETVRRGPYAGIVGYLSYAGSLDTCITIRTIIAVGDEVHVQAGAGIVYDSQPEAEYQETVNKAQALLSAVAMAEEGV